MRFQNDQFKLVTIEVQIEVLLPKDINDNSTDIKQLKTLWAHLHVMLPQHTVCTTAR